MSIQRQVNKQQKPNSTLIEETAMAFAAEVWEQAAMKGLVMAPYKDQRQYIRRNFEKFVPMAVEKLTQMLHGGYPDHMKADIYEALIERSDWKPTINGQVINDGVFGHG